jgi:hypothetical protein
MSDLTSVRNAYLLVNYGDFVDGGNSTAPPYVQLLSTTNDSATTHQDFVTVRLGGKDTTTNLNTNPGNSGSSTTPTSSSSNVRRIAIIAGAAGLGLLFLLVAFCCCCRRKRGFQKATTPGGVMGFGRTYQPLRDPAPNAAVETHALPNLGYNGGQPPPGYGAGRQFQPEPYGSQQQYQTAWDHRY